MPLTDTGLPTADLQCLSADRVMEWAGWYADPCPIRSYSSLSVDNQQVGILTVLITYWRHNSVMYPADK